MKAKWSVCNYFTIARSHGGMSVVNPPQPCFRPQSQVDGRSRVCLSLAHAGTGFVLFHEDAEAKQGIYAASLLLKATALWHELTSLCVSCLALKGNGSVVDR